ncbi:MAG TPA: hypothetical protein VMR25_15625 [Planctomycetaceae bacterium]|nr:hypothetical protein [Planctomycetaceae bacterium]
MSSLSQMNGEVGKLALLMTLTRLRHDLWRSAKMVDWNRPLPPELQAQRQHLGRSFETSHRKLDHLQHRLLSDPATRAQFARGRGLTSSK